MEKDAQVHRSITWFLCKEEIKTSEIITRLNNVCGDDAPSKSSVYRWVDEFKQGRDSTQDAPRAGRPSTGVTTENINKARQLIEENPRLTIAELEVDLGVGSGTVQKILHEELGLSKMSARWIPKTLNNFQKQERVRTSRDFLNRFQQEGAALLDRIVTGDESWFHYYEPESKLQSMEWRATGSSPPVKPRSAPSAGKRMATVFWDREGIILLKWLPQGRTINANYHIETLTELREAIKEKRRGKLTRGILLLQDNASAHTAQTAQAAIRDMGFQQLEHPPYSPDLAPCDYYLFSEMKRGLRGKRYDDLQGLASALSQWEKQTSEEWFAAGIEKLPERCEKCIRARGEYFEKMDDE